MNNSIEVMLEKKALNLRIEALHMLQIAGSGHVGGSFSIAEILSVLFFDEMKVFPNNPKNPDRDRFVLSKGHCTPTAYSVLAHKGFFPVEQLQTFRKINSPFSGHFCTEVPGVDASTGSLGQGLSVALGMAMAGKADGSSYNVYAICGDGEIQEGQIWEAAMAAGHYKVSNLCLFIDNNGLQLDGTVDEIMSIYPIGEKFAAFGWNVIECADGNDVKLLLEAMDKFHLETSKPTVVVAKTVKGKGVSIFENKVEFHGKLPSEEQFEIAFQELNLKKDKLEVEKNMKERIPTRIAYGKALAEFGDNKDIYVFDADLASCTHNQIFANRYPERFFNMGVAEANMVNVAAGFASTGKTAVCASFAIFSSGRAYEQIRNSVAYPKLNVKIVGSHAGLTVGEDGATHQSLEDISLMRTIPNMVVLSPCDANETREAVKAMLEYEGPCYLRTSRLASHQFTNDIDRYTYELGKASMLQDGSDLTICASGYPVYNALGAANQLADKGVSTRVLDFHTIKPIDREAIVKAARDTGRIITIEEHNIIGGLGSAVSEVAGEEYPVKICRIGVKDTFGHSGAPEELLDKHGLSEDKIFWRAWEFVNK